MDYCKKENLQVYCRFNHQDADKKFVSIFRTEKNFLNL